MKTTIFATITALTISAGAASADNFDNTGASVTAEFGRYDLTVKGAAADGFTELSFGANIIDGLDMSVTDYHSNDAYGIGLDYTVTTAVNGFTVWAVAELEYIAPETSLGNGDFFVTPTVGASYPITGVVTAWGEVDYTWNASESFAKAGGVAEVGVDFALADNVTFTPSIARSFDSAVNETQANLNLTFSF